MNLPEIASKNDTTRAMFHLWAARERSRSTTDIRRFKMELKREGFDINEKDYTDAFKSLELVQVGKIVYGRRGGLKTFVWSRPIRDVGHAGLGEPLARVTEIRDGRLRSTLKRRNDSRSRPLVRKSNSNTEERLISSDSIITFILPDFSTAQLKLSRNLSKEELAVLSKTISNLKVG